MGVDFYPCDSCDEVFCACGPHAVCEVCGQYLCEECMDGFSVRGNLTHIEGENNEENNPYGYDQCPFCEGLIISEADLLDFALQMLDITREDLLEKYWEYLN